MLPLLLSSLSFADSAAPLPDGGTAVYGGLAAYTWRKLRFDTDPEKDSTLDRDLTFRLDLYASHGFTDRLSMNVSAPVVWSQVVDDPETNPCPNGPFPCEAVVTLGSLGVQARYAVLTGPVMISPALGLTSSSWNAATRGNYATVGEATTDVQPGLYIGGHAGSTFSFDWMVAGIYDYRTTFYAAQDGAPADDVRAFAELRGGMGIVAVTLGASTYQRFGGVVVASDLGTDDRWAITDYDNLAGTAKVSLALPENMGLHLSATRILWVRNGPPDAIDVSIGVHRWFPG